MSHTPPEPPDGIRNLHRQPGLMDDASLHNIERSLSSSGNEKGMFEELTRYLPEGDMPSRPNAEWRERALSYVKECIEYRDEIRPDSLRTREDLPNGVGRTTAGGWVWYSSSLEAEHSKAESEADTHEPGKYLFFAPGEARALEEIVIDEFEQRPYGHAKLPTIPGKREDWVLCLYQGDNRYWYDVREAHHNPPRVRFRGFKTNSETRRGEYSERFEESR